MNMNEQQNDKIYSIIKLLLCLLTKIRIKLAHTVSLSLEISILSESLWLSVMYYRLILFMLLLIASQTVAILARYLLKTARSEYNNGY